MTAAGDATGVVGINRRFSLSGRTIRPAFALFLTIWLTSTLTSIGGCCATGAGVAKGRRCLGQGAAVVTCLVVFGISVEAGAAAVAAAAAGADGRTHMVSIW